MPPMTGGWFAAADTLSEKLGSDALAVPSDTEITMPVYEPTLAAVGVPLRRPVVELNVAHVGRFTIENVNVWPSASDAVGVKLYACPTVAELEGVPLITGVRFAACTTSVNGASDTWAIPSETRIVMFEYVPMFAAVGVPVSCPVDVLNVAHDGLFTIEKVSAWPSASNAVGVKL